VRDVALTHGERVAVLPGEAVTIGSTILMVQETRARAQPPRLAAHALRGAHRGRVLRAARRGRRSRSSASPSTATARGHVADTISPALRPSDMLALFGPSEYELLLPTTNAELGVAIAQDIVAAAERDGHQRAHRPCQLPARRANARDAGRARERAPARHREARRRRATR
jgi:hypothetical protein